MMLSPRNLLDIKEEMVELSEVKVELTEGEENLTQEFCRDGVEATYQVPTDSQQTTFKCHICGVLLANLPDLQAHINVHDEAKLFFNRCGRELSDILPLEELHGDKVTCDICSRVFPCRSALRAHIMNEQPCCMTFIRLNVKLNDRKTYKCDLCCFVCLRKSSLLKHIKGNKCSNDLCDKKCHYPIECHKRPHTGEKCNICRCVFQNRANLEKHLLKHPEQLFSTKIVHQNNHITEQTAKKKYNCKTSKQVFPFSPLLEGHKNLEHKNHEEEIFNCDECSKVFLKHDDLKRHMLKRHNLKTHEMFQIPVKPLKCHNCDLRFVRPFDLNRHQSVHTGEKPFTCDICSRTFSLLSTLKSHLRVHTGEKPFKCHLCSCVFSQRNNLIRHSAVHTGKVFKCDTCLKAFNDRGSLKRHCLIHTGERPYKCDTCGRAFVQRGDLKNHQTVHTGERGFICEICSKAFTRLTHLKTHQALHTGKKPFKCETCNKTFARRESLKYHQKVHTGERPFKCEICSKAYSRPSYLRSHQLVHKNDTLLNG